MSFVVFTNSENHEKKLAWRSAGAMQGVVFCGSWAEGVVLGVRMCCG